MPISRASRRRLSVQLEEIDNEPDVSQSWRASQHAAQIETAQSGHLNVGDDHVRLLPQHAPQRGFSIVSNQETEALGHQVHTQDARNGLRVVNQQYLLSGRCVCLR